MNAGQLFKDVQNGFAVFGRGIDWIWLILLLTGIIMIVSTAGYWTASGVMLILAAHTRDKF